MAVLGQNNNREDCPGEGEGADGAEGRPEMTEAGREKRERELEDKVCLAARD